MIEVVSKNNLDELLPLFMAYQEFYKAADICDVKNKKFLSQFGIDSLSGCKFLYRDGGKVIGFPQSIFFSSTIASKVAILNDLYTLPEMRGKGIGKKLIEHCKIFAENNAARLQWVTAEDNLQAQQLYDSLDVTRSSWLHYTYNA